MRFPPGIGEGVVLLNFGQPLLEMRPCRFEVCGEWSKGLACAWERLTRASMSARKCYDRYELSGTEAVSLARARKQSVGPTRFQRVVKGSGGHPALKIAAL